MWRTPSIHRQGTPTPTTHHARAPTIHPRHVRAPSWPRCRRSRCRKVVDKQVAGHGEALTYTVVVANSGVAPAK
ncbi:hypothetical protein JM654_16390 [Microbacterium oxydans]|nr:hypothetical protein [Microbacterium oxydans]